jgi:RNA polymerase sigma factor (sigma-70 family)
LYKTAKNQVQLAVRQIKQEQKALRINDLNDDIPADGDFVKEIEENEVMLNVSYVDILCLLSENERRLHKMFYVDGLSTKEIAVALDITCGACRTRLHRVRSKIYDIVREAVGE